MKELVTFRIRWKVRGKKGEEIAELRAASENHARRAFEAYKLSEVYIVSVERVEPDSAAPAALSGSPDTRPPPLVARRKIDKDEDLR